MNSCLDSWLRNSLAMKSGRFSSKAGLGNGELLRRAGQARFEVFLTADRNLEFQQNLVRSSLRVILLVAASNALEDLLPLVPSVLRSIPEASPGQVHRVDGSS